MVRPALAESGAGEVCTGPKLVGQEASLSLGSPRSGGPTL